MKKRNILVCMLFLTACAKQNLKTTDAGIPEDDVVKLLAEPGDIGNDIVCTNNSSNKLEVFNYGDANWNDAGSLRWSWMPTTGLGYTSSEINLWTNGDPTGDPMDASAYSPMFGLVVRK